MITIKRVYDVGGPMGLDTKGRLICDEVIAAVGEDNVTYRTTVRFTGQDEGDLIAQISEYCGRVMSKGVIDPSIWTVDG